MEDKTNILGDIISLLEQLVEDSIKNDKINIEDIKVYFKELLRNPLSSNEIAFILSKKIDRIKTQEKDFQSIWDEIENHIDRIYSTHGTPRLDLKKRLREYEKSIIDTLIEIGKSRGANETFSAIIGYLLTRGKVSQSELRKLSGFSRGAISENLKKLVGTGFIKRKRIDGTRTYQYSLGENMKRIASNVSFIKEIKGIEVEKFTQNMRNKLKRHSDHSEAGYQLLLERLNDLDDFSDMHQDIIQQIKRSVLVSEKGGSEK